MKFKMNLGGLVVALIASMVAFVKDVLFGPQLVRARTRDVAFTFRMGAGFAGDVNRTHPFSILPELINATNPPAAYGNPVLVASDGTSVRGFISSDGSATPLAAYGVTVRSFPNQQQSGNLSNPLGNAAPPVTGVMDMLRSGFIMGKLPAGQAVVKGGAVYVWCAASTGVHVQGQFENAASSTNTVQLTNATFTGPADSTGIVEVEFRVG